MLGVRDEHSRRRCFGDRMAPDVGHHANDRALPAERLIVVEHDLATDRVLSGEVPRGEHAVDHDGAAGGHGRCVELIVRPAIAVREVPSRAGTARRAP